MRLPDAAKKRVFICSQYAGDTAHNIEIAVALCRMAIDAGYAPFAPHLMYTRLLDDSDPHEREVGISLGLVYMKTCEEVWVYTGDGVSDGMRREIDYARMLGIPVIEVREVSLCGRM